MRAAGIAVLLSAGGVGTPVVMCDVARRLAEPMPYVTSEASRA